MPRSWLTFRITTNGTDESRGTMVQVEYREDVTLMDREAIATLTKRSPHTIRKVCRVVERTGDGRPLYDAHECETTLSGIATRRSAPELHAG